MCSGCIIFAVIFFYICITESDDISVFNEEIHVPGSTKSVCNRLVLRDSGCEPLPFSVFVNPRMKIVNSAKFTSRESCVSVPCVDGDVWRYSNVIIEGEDFYSFYYWHFWFEWPFLVKFAVGRY